MKWAGAVHRAAAGWIILALDAAKFKGIAAHRKVTMTHKGGRAGWGCWSIYHRIGTEANYNRIRRCYFCEVSLRVGSYTLHRTPSGQGRFYCEQHVGKEHIESEVRMRGKGGRDRVDSTPVFSMVEGDDSRASTASQVRVYLCM